MALGSQLSTGIFDLSQITWCRIWSGDVATFSLHASPLPTPSASPVPKWH